MKASAAAAFEFSTRIVRVIAYSLGAVFLALYMMIDRDRLRGTLLALPLAAAILMLLVELRVELPGQIALSADQERRRRDDRGEREYERRTEGMGAEQAAAVAVQMTADRKREEIAPPAPTESPG